MGAVMALAAVLLVVILATTTFTARRLGFSVEDEITAVFCGSKKSLANGIPMAKILFAGHPGAGPAGAAADGLSPVAADRMLSDRLALRQPRRAARRRRRPRLSFTA
ncbi:bile acid:sodium symporter [Cupriavidus basilensis]